MKTCCNNWTKKKSASDSFSVEFLYLSISLFISLIFPNFSNITWQTHPPPPPAPDTQISQSEFQHNNHNNHPAIKMITSNNSFRFWALFILLP